MEDISNLTQNQKRTPEDLVLPPMKHSDEDNQSPSLPSDNFGDKDNSNEEILENNQNGRWDKEEHMLFLKGCLLYENNWKKVQKYVKTRSSSQIRSHAQKYLIKLSKKHQSLSPKASNESRYSNYNFKQMTNDELDRFIDNLNESSNEMNIIEEYILSIFQPEIKMQEALNATNAIQRRGRKTEPKKKQKTFNIEKCFKVRNQRKNKKNDEVLSYLNSNDPKDLFKLISMAENNNIDDILKNGSSYLSQTTIATNSSINNAINSNDGNGNIIPLPKRETDNGSHLIINMLLGNQPPNVVNQFPLMNTLDDPNRVNSAFPSLIFNNYPLQQPNNEFLYTMLGLNHNMMGNYNRPGFY